MKLNFLEGKGLYGSLMSKRDEHTFQLQNWRKWHKSIKAIKSDKYQKIANQYPISKKEIDEIEQFYTSNYGRKIPYYCHQYYAAHSGFMSPKYFPDFCFMPTLNHS